MKFRNHQAIVAVLLVLLGTGVAAAQTNPTTSANSTYDGRVVVPDASTDADNINSVAAGDRPDRPEANVLSEEVRKQLEAFKLARDQWLAQQEALRKQALGATDEEREKLRRQLAELKAEQLRRARELRKEFEARKDELKDELPSHRELLNELTDDARNTTLQELRNEKLDEQRNAARPRDGVD